MEIYEVIGIRPMKFKGNDGSEVSGTNLYVTYDHEFTQGRCCDKFFVSDFLKNKLSYFPKVGDEVCFDFNRFGKLTNISQLP